MTSPSNPAEHYICIGKISSAHGVKGLVKIAPFCDDVTLLNGTLFTDEKGQNRITIHLKNPIGKHMLAEIDGVTSREQAQTIKHALYIPRDALPDINDNDSFYITDLVGLKAFNTNGETLGTLKAVQNFGAGDLMEIQPPSGDSYFVPFQNNYIEDVNLSDKNITLIDANRFRIE